MNWLKHAFDTSGPDQPPSTEETALVEFLCQEVVRRRMALPALVFLEMSQPLNSLSAQSLHFLAPVLGMFGGGGTKTSDAVPPALKPHEILARFLERPGSIGVLADRIEVLEKEREAASVGPDGASATGQEGL